MKVNATKTKIPVCSKLGKQHKNKNETKKRSNNMRWLQIFGIHYTLYTILHFKLKWKEQKKIL